MIAETPGRRSCVVFNTMMGRFARSASSWAVANTLRNASSRIFLSTFLRGMAI